MPEDLEQPEPLDLTRYLDVIRRRHLQFLLPVLLGWLLVWGLSWVIPVRYKSTTTIEVQQPATARNYLLPNLADDLQDRLQTLQQQILSRTRLLVIVNKLHLYSSNGHILTADQQIERMRKDIDVELVRNPQNLTITSFKVSYSAATPQMAQAVTGELTDLFISENIREREQQSKQTTSFIETQLEQARQSLAGQDAKVREFEAAHQGELPAQQATNLQILSGLQQQLQSEQDALNTARQQRAYFQSLITQYRALQPPARSAGGEPGSLSMLDGQLDKLHAQLAEMSTRYTDEYPGVQALKTQIAKTEQARQRLASDLRARAAAAKAPGSDSVNPELPQSASLLQLEGQLKANDIEISNRERAVTDLTQRISAYQARLNAEPAVQQQLADLTRGYEQSQANYNELLKKEHESEIATNVEQFQGDERFVLLDPPTLPTKPDYPNRLKFCGFGLVAGLALGFLSITSLEFLDGRLRSNRSIEDLLPVGIVTEVPQIMNEMDEVRERRRLIIGWSAAGLVVIVIVAGSAFSYLHA